VLKSQLQEKMKVKREQARQKRQELYALDNEETGADEEEAEMSDRSDTDDEGGGDGEDFEEMYNDDEEEIEAQERKHSKKVRGTR